MAVCCYCIVMTSKERFHPSRALENPHQFYEEVFQENRPRAAVVKVVGQTAVRLSKPQFIFPDAMTGEQFFGQIPDKDPLILSLSHAGKKRFHDVIGGLAAVFTQSELLNRVPEMRVWGATPYLTDRRFGPLIARLGGIPVNRSGDYALYGLDDVSDSDRESVNNALINTSIDFLTEKPGRTIDIFPAGTKGAAKLRDGVGRVAEGLASGYAIPISMASPVQETSNIPKGLVVVFGEPVEFRSGLSSAFYVDQIQHSQDIALASARHQVKLNHN